MSFRFLWYPSLEVPNSDWLRSVILYSDVIGTIVPRGLERRSVGRHIEVLRDSGELEYVNPEYWLTAQGAHGFAQEVASSVQSQAFRTWQKRRRLSSGGRSETLSEYMDLHQNKLTYEIQRELERAGVVEYQRGEWVGMLSDIASSYMAILAKYVARRLDYVPATDRVTYERMIFDPAGRDSRHPVGSLSLSRVLPVPAPFTPLEEIVEFKHQRREELLRFRQAVYGVHDKLANAKSPEEARDILGSFENDLELGVIELERLLKDARMNFRLATVKTLFESKAPDLLPAVVAGVAGLSGAALVAGPKLLGLGVGAGIGLSYSWVRARIERDHQVKTSPFSYVFQARKSFDPFYRLRDHG